MAQSAITSNDVHIALADLHQQITALGVKRLALFGSVLRNDARTDSDVDFIVEFKPGDKTYRHLFALGELLEQRFERRVELVTREALSPFLRQHILSEVTDVVRSA